MRRLPARPIRCQTAVNRRTFHCYVDEPVNVHLEIDTLCSAACRFCPCGVNTQYLLDIANSPQFPGGSMTQARPVSGTSPIARARL
jgi:hypothetical protein